MSSRYIGAARLDAALRIGRSLPSEAELRHERGYARKRARVFGAGASVCQTNLATQVFHLVRLRGPVIGQLLYGDGEIRE